MDIQPPATCGIPTHPTCTALAVHGRARRGRAARLRGWVAGAVLALVASPVLAQTLEAEDEGAAAIAELIQSGDHEAAYERALERRAELEGRPVFDFWYGVSALDAGHVSEGIFALERVSMHRPGSARVRLELARGYFLAGEDRRARRHFEAVLAQEPPEPVAATVERYLHAIRQRADRYTTVVTGYVEARGGHDTNVNSATDAEQFDLFGVFPVQLAEESREQSDDFVRLAAGGELRRPLTPDVTFFAGGDIENTAHGEYDDFDTRVLEARSGAVFHYDRGQTRAGLRLQRFDVGGEAYRDLVGLDLNTSWRLSPQLVLNGGLELANQTYDEQETRDASLTIVSGGITRIWNAPMRPVTSLGVFIGREDPDENSDTASAVAERDMSGISGNLRLRIAPEWRLTTALQYRSSKYGAKHVLTQETREEDYYQADLNLDWQPATHWRLGPRLRHSVNDANVELHDYERTVFELHARYAFH